MGNQKLLLCTQFLLDVYDCPFRLLKQALITGLGCLAHCLAYDFVTLTAFEHAGFPEHRPLSTANVENVKRK